MANGILGGPVDGPARAAATFPNVEATIGLSVIHRASKFRGTLLRINSTEAEIKGDTGLVRVFPLSAGNFEVAGVACNLIRPKVASAGPPARTASGSRAAPTSKAQVARAARIVVEGIHDAELIEKVWGDDLRSEAIVVEPIGGLDNLVAYVHEFRPNKTRRLGVLADHLVPNSKETRIAAQVANEHVIVTGTPYVDVWAAVRPKRLGIDEWPSVPIGTDWKLGVCASLGVADPKAFWRDLLSKVSGFADLEVEVVGAVEKLIDFVTAVES